MVVQQVAGPEPTAALAAPGRTSEPPPGGTHRHAQVRRRQIVLMLTGLTGVAFVAAVGSGGAAAWWAFLAMLLATSGYFLLLHHVRQVMAEREFASLLDEPHPDPFEGQTARPSPGAADVDGHPRSQAWAMARFAVADLAGWALTPVVFALTLVLGETPRDATGRRWVANLRSAQEHLRDHSMRTLAISAATTASVATAGTAVAFSGTTAASAAPLAGRVPGGSTYTVVAGDTLSAIAARFGTTAAALATSNHLADPNLIFAGQHLTVPSQQVASKPSWGAPAGGVYRVVAGDTLGSIAARFGTTVATLTAINHLSNPNLIFAGQVLVLAPGATSPTPTQPTPARPTAATPTGGTYRVVAGDTLGSIAARFGTTVAALTAVNHLSNPNLIFAGQVLVVGRGGTTSPAATTPTHAPAPTPAPAPPPVTVSSAAAVAVQVALEQVGKPYQWAGAGPSSFDCSGLVMYAWAHAGVSLPHYSVAQYEDTTRISAGQLQPGDLVFYDTGDGAQPGHVTMYIGHGEIVTADSPGTVVRVEVVDWDGTPMGYGRVR